MAIYSLIKLISFSILLLLGSSSAQLDINYYYSSCPELSTTVKSVVESAIQKEPRMGASLLRLFFHDCFVNGCDGSVLLDDTPSFTGEKTAKPNKGSIRGFEVIDQIKSSLEEICPGVVSCADILAVTARDSVVLLGGPDWDVKVGRKDSTTASLTSANNDLPKPSSDLDTLISNFATKGLSAKDMVALSGAHTIGKASCTNFRSHIYNDSNVNFLLAASKENICPQQAGKGDTNLAPLDFQSETVFDSGYYQNLVTLNGLLHSDQELFNGGPTDLQVVLYSTFTGSFFEDFVSGMVKMGDISPLTGLSGEIRKNCRNIN